MARSLIQDGSAQIPPNRKIQVPSARLAKTAICHFWNRKRILKSVAPTKMPVAAHKNGPNGCHWKACANSKWPQHTNERVNPHAGQGMAVTLKNKHGEGRLAIFPSVGNGKRAEASQTALEMKNGALKRRGSSGKGRNTLGSLIFARPKFGKKSGDGGCILPPPPMTATSRRRWRLSRRLNSQCIRSLAELPVQKENVWRTRGDSNSRLMQIGDDTRFGNHGNKQLLRNNLTLKPAGNLNFSCVSHFATRA